MTTLRFSDVGYRYGNGPEALTEVNVSFGPGVTGVVGANGAGKSTMLRLCNGLLRPTTGQVFVDEVDTRTATVAALARHIGLVFQDPGDQLFRPRLRDDVAFGPANLGLDDPPGRAAAALERVGLGVAGDVHPYELGLAERKLATIAGVLAMDVGALALDEPTMGQDTAGTQRLADLATDLASDGRTVIVVSHDMGFVARCCSRVVVLAGGTLRADGAPRAVFSDPSLLAGAGLAPPPITELGWRLGLDEVVVTIDDLVAAVRARQRS